jgi:serine/threonine protein kinase
MMYEMVVGENPFKITKEEELIKIVKDEIKIPSYLFVSAEVRDFLDRCLQKNPNERGNIKELINHPFFKKNQEKNDKSKVLNM